MRTPPRASLLPAALLLLIALPSPAQVPTPTPDAREPPAADEEPAPPAEVTEFKSPMVLEAAFTAHMPEMLGKPVAVRDWAGSRCGGVSIQTLTLRAEERAPMLNVHLKAFTHTEPGKDKLVDIRFELRKGDRTLGEAWIRKINAEEGDDAEGRTILKVPGADVPRDAPLALRATVHVREN
jgi:hypothetical protein